MAAELSAEGVPTVEGGRWHGKTIRRILVRDKQENAGKHGAVLVAPSG